MLTIASDQRSRWMLWPAPSIWTMAPDCHRPRASVATRVVTIAPGIIAPNAKLSPLYERMVKRVAMQREGEPEDVANAVAFLCSERARDNTGAVQTVTGGMDLFTF